MSLKFKTFFFFVFCFASFANAGELDPFKKVGKGFQTLATSAGDLSSSESSTSEETTEEGFGEKAYGSFLQSLDTVTETFYGKNFEDSLAIQNPFTGQVNEGGITLSTGQILTPTTETAKELLQLAVGVEPDFSSAKNLTDYYKEITNIMAEAQLAVDLRCAWQVTDSYEKFNFAFPDKNAIYQVQLVPNFGPNDVVEIKGEFPDVRYMSIQTYDEKYEPIGALADYQLVADEGFVNPFNTATQDPAENGRFTAYFTYDGKRGYTNEIAVASPEALASGSNVPAWLMIRFYCNDPEADFSKDHLRFWGYKDPFELSLLKRGVPGPQNADSQVWDRLPLCPDSNNDFIGELIIAAFEANDKKESIEGAVRECDVENQKDSLVLYSRQKKTDRAPFTNDNANYFISCLRDDETTTSSTRDVKNRIVAHVTGYLPTTPLGKYSPRFVGDALSYESRYLSLSTIDLNLPGPVIETIYDDQIRNHYYDIYGAEKWEFEMHRNFSFWVADDMTTLERCNIDMSESIHLTTTLEGLPRDWVGVLYREIYPQSMRYEGVDLLAQGVDPTRIYKHGLYDAKSVLCDKDKHGEFCSKNYYEAAEVMGYHYPRITYYLCEQDGKLSEANAVKPDPFAATKFNYQLEHTPPATLPVYYKTFCEIDNPEGDIRVFSPASTNVYTSPGSKYATRANVYSVQKYPISLVSDTTIIGISVTSSSIEDAYFIADAELCGYEYYSDPTWRCTTETPLGDAWLKKDYDVSNWSRPRIVNEDVQKPFYMNENSHWLTSREPAKEFYCRLEVANPVRPISYLNGH